MYTTMPLTEVRAERASAQTGASAATRICHTDRDRDCWMRGLKAPRAPQVQPHLVRQEDHGCVAVTALCSLRAPRAGARHSGDPEVHGIEGSPVGRLLRGLCWHIHGL